MPGAVRCALFWAHLQGEKFWECPNPPAPLMRLPQVVQELLRAQCHVQVTAHPCKCPLLAACDKPPKVKQHAGLSAVCSQSLTLRPLCQSPGRAKVCSVCSKNRAACAACAARSMCSTHHAVCTVCSMCSRAGALRPGMGGRAPPDSRSIPVPLHKQSAMGHVPSAPCTAHEDTHTPSPGQASGSSLPSSGADEGGAIGA